MISEKKILKLQIEESLKKRDNAIEMANDFINENLISDGYASLILWDVLEETNGGEKINAKIEEFYKIIDEIRTQQKINDHARKLYKSI